MIFFAHLRAGLLSILAVKKQAFQVRDLEEALNSDYQLGTIKSGAVQATFEQAPDESLFRRVWNEVCAGTLPDWEASVSDIFASTDRK